MALILDGTNGLSDVDGTAATPAIRGTDTNTGIFFPAADTIAFSEGGTEVARFDSAGNLGIGTTSPTSKVDVSGEIKTLNGTAALGVIIKRTDGVNANGAVNFVGSDDAVDASVRMATDVANALVFTAGGATERMRITSTGQLRTTVTGTTLMDDYGCRAWVNFNGTGTVAIRGSGNVSSITDNGTGQYTVNFTTAMPDVNYSLHGTVQSNDGNATFIVCPISTQNHATGSTAFYTPNSSNNSAADCKSVWVAIFR
jgi:hypothetical protein